jgi:hypothetical protein
MSVVFWAVAAVAAGAFAVSLLFPALEVRTSASPGAAGDGSPGERAVAPAERAP